MSRRLRVGVDPVAAVAEWARASSPRAPTSAASRASSISKFDWHYSTLAASLTTGRGCSLCIRRSCFAWGHAEQRSIDALKAALTSAPVPRVWDPVRPTHLLTTPCSSLALCLRSSSSPTTLAHSTQPEWHSNPSRASWPRRCISLDIMELAMARLCHDFMQVHIRSVAHL